MHSTRHTAKQPQQQPHLQLNYFQQSPVRGQLEPSDGFSKTGWRYLQCTDTPNELRVLLPPRTAMVYAHLLRAEALELAKDKAASWDRIMEIRHLKDRMIRKCQRLSRGGTARDKSTSRVMFFTVHAPPDFRMKELERWFRSQGPEVTQAEDVGPRTAAYCCDKCGPLLPPQTTQPRQPVQSRRSYSTSQRPTHTKASISERIPRRPSASQLGSLTRQGQSTSTQVRSQTRDETSPPPLPVPSRSRSLGRDPAAARQQSTSRTPPYIPTPERSRQASPSHGVRSDHPPRASLLSPDPVPIPYRPRDAEDEIEIPMANRSPSPLHSDDDDLYQDSPPLTPPTPPSGPPTPDPDSVAFPSGPALETIHESGDPSQGPPRPTLPRRRSSLKKSGSMSRLSVISQAKSVSWAMDKDWMDQMANFGEVTKEAESVAKELENIRAEYHDQIHEMREICRNVTAAAEGLPQEIDSFHKEENTLRDQEYRLLAILEDMEAKESAYHRKVIAVLEETKRVVQLCDKKRDHHDV